jgi:PAS domain S-box-containing protein
MTPREGGDGSDSADADAQRLDEELYRTLFEESIDGIAVHEVLTDEDGEPNDFRFLAVNEAFERYTNVDGSAIEGQRLTEVFPGIEETSFLDTYTSVVTEAGTRRFIQHVESLESYYEVSAMALGDGLSATSFVDVTERIDHQQELERYHAILEGMEDWAFVLDEELRVEYANPPVTAFLGTTLQELQGSHLIRELSEGMGDDAAVRRLERTLSEMLDQEGSTVEPMKVEVPLTLPTGELIVEVHCSPLTLQGEPKLLLIARDVTERNRREQEIARTNEQLDAFASRLAHELRNPLTVISSRLALARETGDEEHFDHLERSLNRMERLIDDLLVLANEGEVPVETVPVQLQPVVAACWDVIRSPDTSIEIDTDARIMADEDRLRQLLENLFRNAVEHAGNDVTVRVGELGDGFYVEDDGRGIPEGKREAILEHGMTDLVHGTGLGLTIVREMVGLHGWSLTVTEGPDGGARFEFHDVECASD